MRYPLAALMVLSAAPALASVPLPRTHLAWAPSADVVAPAPAHSSHTFSWVMFGIAGASAIAAGIGGVQLLGYHSFVDKAEHSPGSATWTQAQSQRNNAQLWETLSLGLSINAGGALTSGVIAW